MDGALSEWPESYTRSDWLVKPERRECLAPTNIAQFARRFQSNVALDRRLTHFVDQLALPL
jgi:hypothetical protein